MIDIRKKKLKELFLLLKKEKHIKNTTQAVEFLSILILIKYIDLRFSKQKYNLEFDWDYKGYFFDYCQNVLLSSVNYNFFIEKKEHNKYMLNTLENIIFNLSNDKILYLSYEFLNSINNRYDLCELKEEFDFLIDEMILDTSQSGMYFTPRVLSKVMVSYLNPKADDRIYDPACGTGGFLVESAEHIKDNVKFHLCGNDISFFPLLISNVRLILIGEDDVILQQKNSINNDNDNVNNKYCYNLIMSHPPFGKLNKSSECNSENISCIEYQFLLHIMSSLKQNGKAAVILPEKFLYDSTPQAKKLKFELLNYFNVECVLSLPSGVMMPYSAVKIVILFFSKKISNGSFWLYELNKKEKLNKTNKIKIEDFYDFFDKLKSKKNEENSWNVNIDSLDYSYNILEQVKNNKNHNTFSYFINSNVDLNKINKDLKDIGDSINEDIKYIENKIIVTNQKYKFSKVKVAEVVNSLRTAPLSKDKLLLEEEGSFSVYGGNGVIGFFNEFIHSGKFIIVGRVGALCGNIHYVEGNIWVTNNAIVLECIDLEQVHPPYLARVLSNKNLRDLASGTAQPHITVSKVKNIEVKLPPFEVQIELEEWLAKLDRKFEEQKELIYQLTSKNKSLKKELEYHLLQI